MSGRQAGYPLSSTNMVQRLNNRVNGRPFDVRARTELKGVSVAELASIPSSNFKETRDGRSVFVFVLLHDCADSHSRRRVLLVNHLPILTAQTKKNAQCSRNAKHWPLHKPGESGRGYCGQHNGTGLSPTMTEARNTNTQATLDRCMEWTKKGEPMQTHSDGGEFLRTHFSFSR